MCFSASASFGAAAVLSVIGVASIKKTKSSNQLMFASIPLLFAIQQVSEGILWLTLSHPEYAEIQKITTYIFLFFAQILWPLLVPLAIIQLKKHDKYKGIQQILVGVGIVTAVYLAYALVSFPVYAKAVEHHIVYVQNYPLSHYYYIGTFYVLATIAPPFFSNIKHMWLLGSTILISCIITTLFYENYLVSVWCFFSSIISLSVLGILWETNKNFGKEKDLYTT